MWTCSDDKIPIMCLPPQVVGGEGNTDPATVVREVPLVGEHTSSLCKVALRTRHDVCCGTNFLVPRNKSLCTCGVWMYFNEPDMASMTTSRRNLCCLLCAGDELASAPRETPATPPNRVRLEPQARRLLENITTIPVRFISSSSGGGEFSFVCVRVSCAIFSPHAALF